MLQSKDAFHVLVIGAGSTGLLVAQGLRKEGISCAVYERIDSNTYKHRQRDWTLALHWGSEYLRTCLPEDLLTRLPEAQTDPHVKLSQEQETNLPIYNGKTGELLANADTPTTRRVSRDKVRKLLGDGLSIRHGSNLVGIRDEGHKIVAQFDDGHEATGDALIGCDSVRSYVRTYLVGPEKAALEKVPIVIYNFTQRYDAEQARYLRDSLHTLIKVASHPEIPSWYMLATAQIPDEEDPSTWTFHIGMGLWIEEGSEEIEKIQKMACLSHMKSVAPHFCEPFRSAIMWIPDGTSLPRDRLSHWPKSVPWENRGGRVTLAGDAAHPMLPHRGQGFNNGLEDAARYVQALCKSLRPENDDFRLSFESRLAKSIAAYDDEVLTRGREEIALSARAAYCNTHWDELLASPFVKHGMNKVAQGQA